MENKNNPKYTDNTIKINSTEKSRTIKNISFNKSFEFKPKKIEQISSKRSKLSQKDIKKLEKIKNTREKLLSKTYKKDGKYDYLNNKRKRNILKAKKKYYNTYKTQTLTQTPSSLGLHISRSMVSQNEDENAATEGIGKVTRTSFREINLHPKKRRRKQQSKIKRNSIKINKINKRIYNNELIRNELIPNDKYIQKNFISKKAYNKYFVTKHHIYKKILSIKNNIYRFRESIRLRNLKNLILSIGTKFLKTVANIGLKIGFTVGLTLIIPIVIFTLILSLFLLLDNYENNLTDEIPRTKNPGEFLEAYGGTFQYVADKYNLYASVMIAQSAIETGWGKSIIGNNMFGIKCYNVDYGCVNDVSTSEYVNNEKISINDSFQQSPEGGILGAVMLYPDFLYNGSAFKDVSRKLNKANYSNYKEAAKALTNELHYATNPLYTNLIIYTVETFNLTRYDTPPNNSYLTLEKIELENTKISSINADLGMPVAVSNLQIDNYITSRYGLRKAPLKGASTFHKGVDIAMSKNTPIYATHDGIVVENKYNNKSGNYIKLENGNIATRYLHLNSSIVSVGTKVQKGELIGYMGTTGNSTGVHLHYEVLINGKQVDPYPYLKKDLL